MASSNVHGPARPRAGPITTQFQFGPWTLTAVKSHILESEGTARERFEGQLDLPQVPEMVFAENVLRIQHTEGYGVEFNALDALRRVDPHHDHFKVAVSQAWKEARSECEHIQDVVETTSERIDLEKLKVREKIHFYEDIVLFEDELSDNGTSMMSVKIRVMPSSFFILLRQFMRVDNVIVRVLDTRLYLEAEQNYMLREHSCREKNIQDLKVPAHVITDPNELAQILPVSKEMNEKLVFPSTGGTKEETDSAVR
ncbi:TIPRL-like protein [Mya arenaria]|uniref:TIP41-like protein n=1 Tax=Mya arenaria TaxID=6604 RepID=A0ABY7EE53_MYAAR|nr:TIPRL-like protein [Mya arenaria]